MSSASFLCPRCLAVCVPGALRYQDSEGRPVTRPTTDPFVGPAGVLQAIMRGDPTLMFRRDKRAQIKVSAEGIHPVCPNGDPLPLTVAEWPMLIIGLVGETASGKSLYLAAALEELTSRGYFIESGHSFRFGSGSALEFRKTYGPFLHDRSELPATEAHRAEDTSREPILVEWRPPGERTGVNLLFYDADGTQLSSERQIALFNRYLIHTDIFLVFLTPSVLAGLPDAVRSRGDHAQMIGNTLDTIHAMITVMQSGGRGPQRHASVVVSKSDELRDLQLPGFEDLYEQPEYPSMGIAELEVIMAEDSEAVAHLIEERGGLGVEHAVESAFNSVSYHMVSASGCRSVPGVEQPEKLALGTFPYLKPSRVVEPIVAGLLQLRARAER